jgi:GntR family transcriptional regulator/MocR family aminotransferase
LTRAATSDLALILPERPRAAPAFRWLCSTLREAILDGRLRPGTQLPASRDLAARCRVSRGTVVAAFDQMKAEGYLSAHVGSGTFVNTTLPDSLLSVARTPSAPRSDRSPGDRRLSKVGRRVQTFSALSPNRTRAFRANQPALDLFPTTLWAQVAGRRLRRASVDMLRGCDPMGYGPLRRAIADYLYTARGVTCQAAQVAVVSGVQEALDLCARLFLDPGDRVAVEEPGYVGATLAFEAHGARVCSLPLDSEGAVVPDSRMRDVRLVYLTPAHQFPVGISMSLARRLALIEWARRSGALIFEDDYDSEFRYAGSPVPAMQGLDRAGVVLFAGSFSKVLFPSMRLGYLVVPDDLVDRVSALKSVSRRFEPLLEQAVLADFIVDGHFGRHVRRMREVYATRLGALIDHAHRSLAGVLDISDVEAGLQTVGWLRGSMKGAAAAAAAADRGIEVTSISRYARRPPAREGLVLGFAAVDEREIARGVRELAIAFGR